MNYKEVGLGIEVLEELLDLACLGKGDMFTEEKQQNP